MKFLCLLMFSLGAPAAWCQQVELSGLVGNNKGEELPAASVLVLPDSAITAADPAGRFLVRIATGRKEIIVTYTGYATYRLEANVSRDTTIAVVMRGAVSRLDEVTVNADRYSSEDLVQSSRTGTTMLTAKEINAIPVLGGEADVIKTLQLLPGSVRGVEGTSDLFVRGGAADQNLVLLDGAPIYNTSHLFGFMSVFNPSILDKVESINGGFPAEFGGRLSSVLNIDSRADLADRTRLSGDIGLIASRLYLEQPLVKNKASFWLSGRRTYIDQVVKVTGGELPYFFYDLNGKLIVEPSEGDKLEFSFHDAQDVLDLFRDRNNDGDGITTSYVSTNGSQALRWIHRFASGWSSSINLIRSAYQYDISNSFEENRLMALSDVEDYGAKVLFRRQGPEGKGGLQFGVDWTRHAISPNIITTTGTIAKLLESSSSRGNRTHELAVHLQQEFVPAARLLVNAGLRASAGIVGGKQYVVPEPRLAVRLALSQDESLKLSYSRMAQYMHRISNSAVSTPTDVWYSVTDEIAPQTSHQVAAAWQRFVTRDRIFLSLEGYYKTMQNLIGYEEGTNLFFNTDFESKLIQGAGRSYGIEVLMKKEAGRLNGWISYTLSWARRNFRQINGGDWFPARYDRRHNGAIVTQYAIGERWAASLVWEFISGARFTPVVGQYIVLAPTMTGVDLVPLYSGVNAVKLSDTHRLDVGLKFMSKQGSRFQWQWFAGVYNVYNRASPAGMIIEQDETDGSLHYLQPGLFGLLPFISYSFRF